MIQIIAEGFNSETDRSGNRYWAFRITNAKTGSVLKGSLGAAMDGAMRHAVGEAIRSLGWEWSNVKLTELELPSRKYKQLVKGWRYTDLTGDSVVKLARGGPGGGKRRHATAMPKPKKRASVSVSLAAQRARHVRKLHRLRAWL